MELMKLCMNISFKKMVKSAVYLSNYRSCSTDISLNTSKSYEILLRHKMKLFMSQIRKNGLDSQDYKYIVAAQTKHRGEDCTTDHFVDCKRVMVKGGNGGDGGIFLLHLCYNEFAGMSGGNGGKGGHVLFESTHRITSLCAVNFFQTAPPGVPGGRKHCDGANAKNLTVEVPVGTKFYRDGNVVCQLLNSGDIFIAARGGVGGKGNSFYAADMVQKVEMAQFGGIGEEFIYFLQMQIIANVGMIGCPNAGKSTLLRAISRARPKVASYPFTTLRPHLGAITYEDYEQLRVADLPGLIEGSHLDEGLGIGFLKHVERCQCLLYVIDMSQPDPIEQFNMLISELEHFSKGLSRTPHCLVANKMDVPQSEINLKKFQNHFEDMLIIPISGKYGKNLKNLAAMMRYISDFKMDEDEDIEYMKQY